LRNSSSTVECTPRVHLRELWFQVCAPRALSWRMSDIGKRPAAVFTIVREEAVFLPIWLRYYAAHFAPEDIYVLHHVVPGGPEDRCPDAHPADPDPGPLPHP
jgi:hypothetical protein